MWDVFNNFKGIFRDYGKLGALNKRMKELPGDYRLVFRKIQSYMWNHTEEDVTDLAQMVKYQYKLMDLFESGAADRRHVLEITGEDVAAFCDKIINKSLQYTEFRRRALNRSIKRKIGKGLYLG